MSGGGSQLFVYTVWRRDSELTFVPGSFGPPGHELLHTIEATDWEAACQRYHELREWEPYKPMEGGR